MICLAVMSLGWVAVVVIGARWINPTLDFHDGTLFDPLVQSEEH